MISVILTDIEKVDNRYAVTLGNGCFFSFGSLKKAKAFNCEVSRFLTKKVLVLNAVYTELLTIGRKQWAISENRQHKGKNNFILYKEIKSNLDMCADWFEYITSYRCHSGIYSFVCIEKIVRSFEELFDLYSKAFGSSPVHAYSIDLEKNKYVNRSIIQEIKNYGLNDCTKVIEILVSDFDLRLKETFLNVG